MMSGAGATGPRERDEREMDRRRRQSDSIREMGEPDMALTVLNLSMA